jgi:malonyl-CoA O-methyltransferase
MSDRKLIHLDMKKRRRGFERAANSYDKAAVLQREIGDRLESRLDYVKLDPSAVLDLGCGTGYISEKLMRRYTKAQIFATDIALSMLHKTAEKGGWFRKPHILCSEAECLPFGDDSFDLVMSNLMLQWCDDLPHVFTGVNRILKPDSLFSFASFGPDTLKELRESWQYVDNHPHTNPFADMHDVGDALMQAGFQQPVLDMEMITVHYSSLRALMMDLKNIGASNATLERQRGLTGKQTLKHLEEAYQPFRLSDGSYPLSYEVVYGHAWSSAGIAISDGRTVIPINVKSA